jgi:hypothetical protein
MGAEPAVVVVSQVGISASLIRTTRITPTEALREDDLGTLTMVHARSRCPRKQTPSMWGPRSRRQLLLPKAKRAPHRGITLSLRDHTNQLLQPLLMLLKFGDQNLEPLIHVGCRLLICSLRVAVQIVELVSQHRFRITSDRAVCQ